MKSFLYLCVLKFVAYNMSDRIECLTQKIEKMKKCILVAGLALLAMPLAAQKTDNLLKVKGEAILSYTPEEMRIVVSIEAKDTVYANCSDILIRTYNSVVDRLIAAGIDKGKIKSGNIRFSENIRWDRAKDIDVNLGYIGRQSVIVEEKYSNEQLAKIANALKVDTLYSSYTINFQLSEKQKNEALQLVIEGAIKDAVNKAQIIANATNVQLVKIKDINYNHTSSYDDLVQYSVALDSEDYGEVPGKKGETYSNLTPAPVEIKKSINIIWEIKGGGKK